MATALGSYHSPNTARFNTNFVCLTGSCIRLGIWSSNSISSIPSIAWWWHHIVIGGIMISICLLPFVSAWLLLTLAVTICLLFAPSISPHVLIYIQTLPILVARMLPIAMAIIRLLLLGTITFISFSFVPCIFRFAPWVIFIWCLPNQWNIMWVFISI